MSIQAVVFDFGNVLGFFSHRRAAEQLARYAPPNVTVEDLLTFVSDADQEHAYEEGRLSTAEILARLRRRFDVHGEDEQLELAIADMFTPNEPVCSLIPLLHGRYRLLLLSNTNDIHYRFYRKQYASTLDLFDALIVSHEVGIRKPDARIYHHTQARAGCPAEQCLFVDDMPVNIAAARACGWQGIVYRKGDDLRKLLIQAGVPVEA